MHFFGFSQKITDSLSNEIVESAPQTNRKILYFLLKIVFNICAKRLVQNILDSKDFIFLIAGLTIGFLKVLKV